jgi:hypothetical protein
MGEREAGAVACQTLVHRVAIDNDGAAIVAKDLPTFLRRFPGEDAIEGGGRRRHTPDGARGDGARSERGPARFVDMNDRRGERLTTERLDDRQESRDRRNQAADDDRPCGVVSLAVRASLFLDWL